jgi:hypothetical protein
MTNDTDVITLGADPELVIVDSIDETPLMVADLIPTHGVFGADGHGYIAELRPEKAISPSGIVDNVRKALASGLSLLNDNDWRAGPYILDKPCGGHIHIGVPEVTPHLFDAIQRLGGPILGILEPEEQAKARRTTPLRHARGGGFNNGGRPYGSVSDIRVKPYGFEWRTPSSFITRPSLAITMFAVAKAIVFEELSCGKASIKHWTPETSLALRFNDEDFLECSKEIFVPMLPTVLKLLRKMQYFRRGMEGSPLWSSVVSALRRAADKRGFYTPKDIKRNWKLADLYGQVPQLAAHQNTFVEPLRPIYRTIKQKLEAQTITIPQATTTTNTFTFTVEGTGYTLYQTDQNMQEPTVVEEHLTENTTTGGTTRIPITPVWLRVEEELPF